MATLLRAFLMLRHTNGTWNVEAYLELEPLLATWEKHNDGENTAVIHLGFYCPPSKTFDNFAQNFPGRILLTAAAKFALPNGYEASFYPIDNVDGLPIYLATNGWGNECDELYNLASANPNLYFKEKWLLDFVDSYASYIPQLLENGIINDSSYIKHEHALDYNLRQLIGEFRLTHLIGNETEDPCLFSKSAPPWLTKQEFRGLYTTVRIANAFQKAGIVYISDLQKLTLGKLLKLPNFGRKSVSQLMEVLRSALKSGPLVERDGGLHTHLTDSSLLSALQRTLSFLTERQADILKRRMGLNSSPETLDKIGVSYAVGRERIRQIETIALERLLEIETWDDLLSSKLHELLNGRKYPLPLLGIEAIDAWFEGVGEHPEAIRYLLNAITSKKISLISIDDIEYFSFMTVDKWNEIQREASNLLSSGIDQQWTEELCKSLVRGLLPANALEFSHILWKKTSERFAFTEQNGEKILQMQGRGANMVVLAVLDESPIPLHHIEIANLAATRSKTHIAPRRAHQAAIDIAILLGRGIYGLPKHLALSSEELDTLGKAAESLVFDSDVERQWHCREILELLPNAPSAADIYHLDYALKRRGNLRNLGRMVWSEPGALSETTRLEVRETALTAITSAGGPLTTTELRQRICAIRGLGQHFQIIPSDPLLRVGRSIWGLNDRDFTTKREDQPRLLKDLVATLQKRGMGVHISELDDLLETNIPFFPDEVFGLYVLEQRLAATSGQDGYIYLREWGESRRETIAVAAKNIMKNNVAKPIHIDDLAVQVSNRIGRTAHVSFLYNALKAIEARLLGPSTWIYDGERNDNVDEIS